MGSARQRATRRTVLGFAAIVLATLAIVAAVIVFFMDEGEEVAEETFPVYWNQLEEGELTERALRERLGSPDEVEDECLIYGDLVEAQRYEFCFRDGVLFKKAAI